jgi:ABC-type transport system substrate-binding protein
MKKPLFSLLAVVSLTSLLMAGCSGKKEEATSSPSASAAAPSASASSAAETQPASQASQPSGTVRFFINSGATWDPAAWDWGGHHDLIGIFEGLVHFSQGKIVPGVAESWKEDGATWTFNLRKDAKFSNGDPVDANTFVYSIRRAIDPKTLEGTGKVSSFLGDVSIKNVQDVQAGKKTPDQLGVKAVDDYTLQFELDEPDPLLLNKLAIGQWALPVDPKVVDGQPATIWQDASKIIGNGPYMIDTLNVKTGLTLKPNPNYYGKVSLASIQMTWSNSQTKQLLVYQNNEADMALLSAEDIPAVKNNPAQSKELNWFDTAITYAFQVRHSNNPALLDQRVRQAFEMAIDKQAIVDKVLQGGGVPSYDALITPWMADWIKTTGNPFDVAKAKQLLADAGYPGGKGFPPVVMLVPGADDKVAQAVQQMWQDNLGVQVKYDGEEWGTYITKFDQLSDEGTVSFAQNGTGAQLPDWTSTIKYSDITNNVLLKAALDGKTWQGYYAIQTDTKLDAGAKKAKQIDYLNQHGSKEILDAYNKGVDAFSKGDEAGMKNYVQYRQQSAWVIPVYQVRNAVLLKPNVKGYFPQRMWLSTPPDWLNDITVSK